VSLGGALASASVLLDDRVGWRASFGAVGAASAVAALVAFVALPKMPPSAVASVDDETPAGALGDVVSSPAVVALLLATATRFAAGFTIGVWALPCLRAAFPDQSAESLGLGYAVVVGGAGLASALLGGVLADAAAAKYPRNAAAARALVPAAGSLVAAPLWVAALGAKTFDVAVVLLALEFLAAESWIGPTTALLQTEVPPRSRGLAQGTFTALTLPGCLAPLAIGRYLDADAARAAPPAVAAAVAAAYVASAVLFVVAAGLFSADRDKGARDV
jgi:predicted MFS family arabinose efflux permease